MVCYTMFEIYGIMMFTFTVRLNITAQHNIADVMRVILTGFYIRNKKLNHNNTTKHYKSIRYWLENVIFR